MRTDAGERPTVEVREALTRLLQRNGHTADAVVGEMYLGKDIFVARLVRPIVLEGDWEDVARTVDIFDLIHMAMEEKET